MTLSPALIEQAKNDVEIQQYFTATDNATAKHHLYNEFIQKTKWKGLPKVIFYILMDELYPIKKAADGNLGYCVTLNDIS